MQQHSYETIQDWLKDRQCKIMGSRLKNLVLKRGTAPKIGFYELIAERIAIPQDAEEDDRDRGHRLEKEALERFEKETGKKVNSDLVIWTREDNQNIGVSPDGFIEDGGVIREALVIASTGTRERIREAVEAKCLSSANHVQALLTQKVPSEFVEQTRQYFIVNDDLETLYLAFYDPTLMVKDFFYLTIRREDIEGDIEAYHQFQIETLARVEEIVNELTY